MGKRSGPSMMKRQKEMTRQLRQQEKTERRKAAKEQPRGADGAREGEDPDIAGIVPGPQASTESGAWPAGDGWQDQSNTPAGGTRHE